MSKLPYMQFYPSDWLNDPALRAVSHTAKGVWIDMLCLMWISPERGALRFISGRNPEPNMIAKALGLRPIRYAKVFTELLDSGVLSVTDDGAIVSRRMLRDEELRRKRTAAGQQGGNPNLVKQKVNQPVKQIPDVRQSHISESESDKGQCPSLASPSSARESEPNPPSVDLPTESPDLAELLDATTNELIVTWNGLRGVLPYRRRVLGFSERATLERWLIGSDRLDWRAVLEKFPLRAFPPGLDGGWQPSLGWLLKADNAWKVLEGEYDFTPGAKPQPTAAPRRRVRLGDSVPEGGAS